MPKLLRLACELTDAEKLVVGGNLSAALTALDAAKAARKLAMEVHKEKIDDLETSIHTINVSLSTGKCEREVEVEDRKDAETGKVTLWRLDTNEVVNTRSLEPEERQLEIGQAPGPASLIDLGAERNRRTEEQNAAATPAEAEELRDSRLAEEASKRAFEGLSVGDEVEIDLGSGWQHATVVNKTEYHFESFGKLFDVSKHLISWRLVPTWDDVKAESAERQRLAEIEQLAAQQAADKPPTLLKAPKRSKAPPKTIKVVDEKDEPLVPPADEADGSEHAANADGGDGLIF